MAKNDIDVKVKISDGGSLKETGKSARDMDRRLKGAARTSSNATKNFSKMSQGISGGLVPAYATLAAQIFAVSAAFRFLQSAADYKNLIEGQQIYGAVTGTAFKSITNSIIEATNAQIRYSDAAQAAAIGTAAGLDAEQLERLGKAAKNVSLALGRDVTDSFNRLIRGTTKAEPELLDELGIILRLEPALKKYALAIGKNAKELTQFERSQAIANEVLEQSERKYGRIADLMDENAFAVNKFAKSFDDLLNSVKLIIAKGLNPIVGFLSNNVAALAGLLLLLAVPIVKAIIPNLQDWEKQAKKTVSVQTNSMKKLTKELKGFAKETENLGKKGGAALLDTTTTKAAQLAGQQAPGRAGSYLGIMQGGEKLTEVQFKRLQRQYKKNQGMFANMSDQMYRKWGRTLKQMELAHSAMSGKVVAAHRTLGQQISIIGKKIQLGWASTMSFMAKASRLGARAINAAFKVAGVVGLFFMLADISKMVWNWFKKIDKTAAELAEKITSLTEKLSILSTEISGMGQARAEGLLTIVELVEQLGQATASLNLRKLNDQMETLAGQGGIFYGEGDKFRDDLGNIINHTTEEYQKLIDQNVLLFRAMGRLEPAYARAADELENNKFLSRETRIELSQLSVAAREAEQASKGLADAVREVDKGFEDLIGTAAKDPMIRLSVGLKKLKTNLVVVLGAARKELAKFESDRAAGKLDMTEKDAAEYYTGLQRGVQRLVNEQKFYIENEAKINALILNYRDVADEAYKIELEKLKLKGRSGFEVDRAKLVVDLAEKRNALDKANGAFRTAHLKYVKSANKDNADEHERGLQLAYQNVIVMREALAAQRRLNKEKFYEIRLAEQALNNAINLLAHQKKLEALRKRPRIGAGTGFGAMVEEGRLKKIAILENKRLQTLKEQAAANLLSAKVLFGVDSDQYWAAHKAAIDTENQAKKAGNALNDILRKSDPLFKMGVSFATNFDEAFDSVIDGSKSFREAFSEMTRSILIDIAKMYTKMLILQMIPGSFGGGLAAVFGGNVNRGGYVTKKGIIPLSRGGVVPGHGNRDTVPAMLTPGEVVTNPARGQFAGQNNNVVVNVSIDGNGNASNQTEEQRGKQAALVGKLVSTAVTEELVRQKRPGGILSPYGGSP